MEIYSRNKKKLNKKGFSLVELIVVIAIMAVLLAVLAPSLLRYVEDSRMQRDESAVDEVSHAVHLDMADSATFDAVYSYSIPNNYTTYTDSSAVYGSKYTDEEFWAPDGSGRTVTITFNPDANGDYNIAEGVVNNMTAGNGSLSDARSLDTTKQCTLSEMGNQELYTAIKKTIGTTLEETSATYKNSSYTIFINFDTIGAQRRVDVYGEWNGTNLSPSSTVSNSSGNSTGQPDDNAPTPPPSQSEPSQPNIPPVDLGGSGGTVPGGGGTTPAPHTHNYTTVTTPATCTKDGLETKTCSCGDTYTEVIPATGHSEKTIPGAEPTCTKSGKTESKQCSVCNTVTQTGTSIAALGHNYTSSTQAATCTTADKTIYTCSNCGDSYTENGNALGHNIVKQPGEPATCTATGLTEGEYCTRCSYKVDQRKITALGHADTNKDYICDNCGCALPPCGIVGHLLNDGQNHNLKECEHYACVCPGCVPLMVIPEGGKYIDANGTTYNPGDTVPAPTTGDTYTFGDYEYCYNHESSYGDKGKWITNESIEGWGVNALSNKQTYGPILTSINNKPITSLTSTFEDCSSLTTPPEIPSTVKNMDRTFLCCYGLKDAGLPQIPNGVESMNGTFYYCTGIKDVSNYNIPSSVTNMSSTFMNCTNLTKAPILPTGVKNLQETFYNCTNLLAVPEIPEGVTSVWRTFKQCYKMKTPPTRIPTSVTHVESTFYDCHALQTAPILHDKVASLHSAFYNCYALQEAPIIPDTMKTMQETFRNCTSLTRAPKIPANVQTIYYAFAGCTSLQGDVQIDTSGFFTCSGCFDTVDFAAQQITLTGNSTKKDAIGQTGINYCTVCKGCHLKNTASHTCHGGTTATCINKATCVVCNQEYGDFGAHVAIDGVCTLCGQVVTEFETAHNYANSQNYIVLGHWDYSDAKSVNITIQYETETSCDWISIVEGSDYIAGSSYTQTKNYLNTSGNIVSAIGTNSSVKFSGSSRTIKTFTDVNMLQGTVVFRSDSSVQKWGAKITITPNY